MSRDIDVARRIADWTGFVDPASSWVLFREGTCVVVDPRPDDTVADVAARGRAILQHHGPVGAGSPAGDFGVRSARDQSHWLVYFDRPDIFGHVYQSEVQPGAKDVTIGFLGRQKRGSDASALDITHVHVTDSPGTLHFVTVNVWPNSGPTDDPERFITDIQLFSAQNPDASTLPLQENRGKTFRVPVLARDAEAAEARVVWWIRNSFGYLCEVAVKLVEAG